MLFPARFPQNCLVVLVALSNNGMKRFLSSQEESPCLSLPLSALHASSGHSSHVLGNSYQVNEEFVGIYLNEGVSENNSQNFHSNISEKALNICIFFSMIILLIVRLKVKNKTIYQ